MNTLKTLLVAAVLSTLAYGLYSNYSVRPGSPPPSEAAHWDTAPQVLLPPASGSPASTPPGSTGANVLAPSQAPNTALPFAPVNSLPAAPASFATTAAAPGSAPSSTTAPAASGSSTAAPAAIPPLPVGATPAPSAHPAAPPIATAAPTADGSPLPGVSLVDSSTSPSMPPPVNAGPTVATAPPQMSATMPPSNSAAAPAGPSSSAVQSPAQPVAYGVLPTSHDPQQPSPSASPAGIAPAQPQAADRERFVAAMGQVQTMLDSGQIATALQALSEWVDHPTIPADEYVQLLDLLDRLAATVIYSREHLLEPPYVVQPGDTLLTLADRCQVPWQLLGKINGIVDPRQIRPGDQIKMVRGPFDAVVNLRTNEVTLLLRGRYAGRFPCAVGQDAATPVGEYAVREKRANPTYYGPAGIKDADDPDNPLGERQLDLGNKLSLHGTNDPTGLSPSETRGSIRLSRTDIEDVFDILSVGSRVVIRR